MLISSVNEKATEGHRMDRAVGRIQFSVGRKGCWQGTGFAGVGRRGSWQKGELAGFSFQWAD